MPKEKTFFDLELQSSIVYDSTNPDAIDKTAPLPFLDWARRFVGLSTDPNFLLNEYKNYVNDWFTTKNTSAQDREDLVKNLYVSLFRNIAVNLLTQSERRFVENVDITKDVNAAAILPIFVRKIKDVALYFASLRDTSKSAVYKSNIKGSAFSLQKAITEELNNSFLIPELNKLLVEAGVTTEGLKSKLEIDIDELIDKETNYLDINSTLPASGYDATGDRAEFFSDDSYEFSPELFIDFDKSVVAEIKKYPVVLKELGNNFAVNLDFSANDIQFLKDQDYKTLVNDLENTNLRIDTLRDALQHFSGTTFYYLSSNEKKEFKVGKLFEATEFQNYLNRRFPTVAYHSSNKLVEESEIGSFFKPSKTGVQNFLCFELNGTITDVASSTIYVFPDPAKYGNITGLSRTNFDNPFSYSESVENLKVINSNTFRFGQALSDYLTKFRGYQSRSESLNYDPAGVSRVGDPVEFFTGEAKDNWSNGDVFKQIPFSFQPTDKRQQFLLVNNHKTLYQSKQDIFGNEFALFKEIKKKVDPEVIHIATQGETITLFELDGQTFYDGISSYNPPVDLILNTQFLSTTNFEFFIPCIKFYPELDFYRSAPFAIDNIYDALEFEITRDFIEFTVLECLSGFDPNKNVDVIDNAAFLNTFKSLQDTYIDRYYFENNNLIGETLSSAETQLVSAVGTLSADLSLYEEYNVHGDLYFRDYAGTEVTPVSAVLSAFFIKYPSAIKSELETKVKFFDIIYDNIIFETDNYLLFETLKFDYDNNIFIRRPDTYNYVIKGTNEKFEFFTNTWFNETKREVYFATTNLLSTASATNYKEIYFEFYRYDFDNIQKLYPNFAVNFNTLSAFTLSGTSLSAINIVEIERPILNYGKDTGKFTIKYLAKDSSGLFYDTKITFKLSNVIYNMTVEMMKADMFLHSENFGNNTFSNIGFTKVLSPFDSSTLSILNDCLVIA